MIECAKRAKLKTNTPLKSGLWTCHSKLFSLWSWAHSMVLQRLDIHLLEGSQLSCVERETHIFILLDVTRELPGLCEISKFSWGRAPRPHLYEGKPFLHFCACVYLTSLFLILSKKSCIFILKSSGPCYYHDYCQDHIQQQQRVLLRNMGKASGSMEGGS